MRRLLNFILLISALSLTACGGGGTVSSSGGGGGGTSDEVGSVEMSSGRSSVPADGATAATITVIVRNEDGDLMTGEDVSLATSTGTLSATTGTTNALGRVEVTLTVASGTSASTVTITATAGGITGELTLGVITSFLSSLELITSSPQLQSDGSAPVTLTVFAQDQNNNLMEGVQIGFSSDSGTISDADLTTGTTGSAQATLNVQFNRENRTITVTVTATDPNGLGQLTDTLTVNVIGTSLAFISGPDAAAVGQTPDYTVQLTDSGGAGINNQTITFSSANGNTLTPTSVDTDSNGRAAVELNVSQAGDDTLTATGLGETAIQNITVSDDTFALTAPTEGVEVDIGTNETVELTWTNTGGAVAGEPVTLFSTGGVFTSSGTQTSTGVTDGSGVYSDTISATEAGPVVIDANSDNTSLTDTVEFEFVATTPATISLQANPLTIGPNEQTTITARVLDAAMNPVKNEVISFSLSDVTGGSLSRATATTNSQGQATVVYSSSSSTSSEGGVVITGTVASNAGINDDVAVTVAGREVFIAIGTGNELFEEGSTQYRWPWVVQVTDASGAGVANASVQLSVLSVEYYKGFWSRGASVWEQNITAGACADEDVNRNGILDAGEDFNGSGSIEAGNVASVVSSVTTDETGSAQFDVLYPQSFAQWVNVVISASASVTGTEFKESQEVFLAILADDLSLDTVPPGQISPYGDSASCADTD